MRWAIVLVSTTAVAAGAPPPKDCGVYAEIAKGDFARGKTTVTVPPNKCTLVKDGADSFIISGSGTTWLGLRPPEGVDYQTFSMLRWP